MGRSGAEGRGHTRVGSQGRRVVGSGGALSAVCCACGACGTLAPIRRANVCVEANMAGTRRAGRRRAGRCHAGKHRAGVARAGVQRMGPSRLVGSARWAKNCGMGAQVRQARVAVWRGAKQAIGVTIQVFELLLRVGPRSGPKVASRAKSTGMVARVQVQYAAIVGAKVEEPHVHVVREHLRVILCKGSEYVPFGLCVPLY